MCRFRYRNNRFVSLTKGYQIYNYIMHKHIKLTQKEIQQDRAINLENVCK